MNHHVTVVGSGPSGVHFAETALDRGYDVTLIDVGRPAPEPVAPMARFDQLIDELPDSSHYLLGDDFSGVTLPDAGKEYYGIPPSKRYVFEDPERFVAASSGFSPLFSLAGGGLAQAWTAGCYPFNDRELADFPFDYAALGPHYDAVSRRIGITGEADDLAPFMPIHKHLLPPIPLDEHSAILAAAYARRRGAINSRFGAYLGRTRVATLTSDLGERHACTRLGRCLWGCPRNALYTPSHTLEALRHRANFQYLDGLEVIRFESDADGRATSVEAQSTTTGERTRIPVQRLALAAGALSTAALVLRSIDNGPARGRRLTGLMDNRQILVPFLSWRMLGRPHAAESYQYHLLGMSLVEADARMSVHAQITTLKTALIHPIAQRLPFDMNTSLAVTRLTRSALGVVNVNLADWRRASNWVEIDREDRGRSRLVLHYSPPTDEAERLRSVLERVGRVLGALGCILPPGMQHARPMGASVHYAGLLPMTTADEGPLTTDAAGRLRGHPNVIVADGAAFPFLPAKNITFTLMANASRLATAALP
jgi:choline dehydrogenase-like flavoprotein